jgi:hypothetical protein
MYGDWEGLVVGSARLLTFASSSHLEELLELTSGSDLITGNLGTPHPGGR